MNKPLTGDQVEKLPLGINVTRTWVPNLYKKTDGNGVERWVGGYYPNHAERRHMKKKQRTFNNRSNKLGGRNTGH